MTPDDRPHPSDAGASRTMRLLAPAKVNLHLRVGPPRADGFHPLLTWMCTVGLFDRLTIEARSPGAATDAPDRGMGASPMHPEEHGRGAHATKRHGQDARATRNL